MLRRAIVADRTHLCELPTFLSRANPWNDDRPGGMCRHRAAGRRGINLPHPVFGFVRKLRLGSGCSI